MHITCPICGWTPKPQSRWVCDCKGRFNSFDTTGVCPYCLRVWEQTQCLSCRAVRPHVNWYEFRKGKNYPEHPRQFHFLLPERQAGNGRK